MPFCYAPWTNLDVSPQGQIGPCCKFQHATYDTPFNIANSSLDQYTDSAFLAEIKQQFLKGLWPRGCDRCRIEETAGIKSKRQLDQERWADHYQEIDLDQPQFITASIAFGNTCNLKCITCGPQSSSRWHDEYLALWGRDIKPVHFYKQDFAQNFARSLPNPVHLDIPGGEPFVSGVDQQQALLALYQSRHAQMTLHYTTNATIWPEPTWWALWRGFKEIDLQISLDAVGDRFEYIRFPAQWQQVERHIDQYLEKQQQLDNLRLSVSVTVSAYNIAYLDELMSWCAGKGLPEPWLGRVHNPAYMRPTVWPAHARQFIMTRLETSGHSALKSWALMLQSYDDSEHFGQFQTMMSKHDQYRGVDFAKTFPDLARFL